MLQLVPDDGLREALSRIEGVVESDSAFTRDLAFWVNGREIAHFEGQNAIDIRLTRAEIRARRTELRQDPRIELRPNSSDWLTASFPEPADQEFVIGLMEIAAAAHRQAAGATAKPPPTGAALERRRRFH
jgi:hypothetical protein